MPGRVALRPGSMGLEFLGCGTAGIAGTGRAAASGYREKHGGHRQAEVRPRPARNPLQTNKRVTKTTHCPSWGVDSFPFLLSP